MHSLHFGILNAPRWSSGFDEYYNNIKCNSDLHDHFGNNGYYNYYYSSWVLLVTVAEMLIFLLLVTMVTEFWKWH
jgi:hypothetical protein